MYFNPSSRFPTWSRARDRHGRGNTDCIGKSEIPEGPCPPSPQMDVNRSNPPSACFFCRRKGAAGTRRKGQKRQKRPKIAPKRRQKCEMTFFDFYYFFTVWSLTGSVSWRADDFGLTGSLGPPLATHGQKALRFQAALLRRGRMGAGQWVEQTGISWLRWNRSAFW